MRKTFGVLYWIFAGLLSLFAIYAFLVDFSLYFILIPVALVAIGSWWPGLRYFGVFLVAFGTYPALFLTMNLLGQVATADWSCSRITFSGYGGDGRCAIIPVSFILTTLGFCAMTLCGIVLLYRLARTYPPAARRSPAAPPEA